MALPKTASTLISTLTPDKYPVTSVELLGQTGNLNFSQDSKGLLIQLPSKMPCKYAISLKLSKSVKTGVKAELNQELKMEVFPNPLKGKIIEVSLSGGAHSEVAEFQLFNIQGKRMPVEIKNNGLSYEIIVMDSLPKGVYLLVAQSGKYIITRKLIVGE